MKKYTVHLEEVNEVKFLNFLFSIQAEWRKETQG